MPEPNSPDNRHFTDDALHHQRGSLHVFRSLWLGGLLGLMPWESGFFWLALTLPLILTFRLHWVGLAAISSYWLGPQIDQVTEPIGELLLSNSEIRSFWLNAAKIPMVHLFKWYNSIVVAYAVIFALSLPVIIVADKLATAFRSFLLQKRTASLANANAVWTNDQYRQVQPNVLAATPDVEKAVLHDACLQETLQFNSLSLPSTESVLREEHLIREIEDISVSIRHTKSNGRIDAPVAVVPHSDEASFHLPNVLTRKHEVNETFTNLVRFHNQKQSQFATVSKVKSAAATSSNSAKVDGRNLPGNAESDDALKHKIFSEAAEAAGALTAHPPTIEPLPFLMGYLVNAHRSTERDEEH